MASLIDSLKGAFRKIVPSKNDRILREILPKIELINALEPEMMSLDDSQLRAKTQEFRARLKEGETIADLLTEAYACVRESSRRFLFTETGIAMRHFDVQLVGGIVLNHGGIAEMVTGEGKTLVATLPAYLNALPGKGVHIITVNDYLARRDATWMSPVFEGLGITVGAIQSNMTSAERIEQYSCDITYGTNNEFGFDYLRDNMKVRPEDQCQKQRHFAIIDEVDSILIDEARTPLIISGPAEKSTDLYYKADRVVRQLVKDRHFEVKEKEQQVILSEEGIEIAEGLVGVDSFYSPANMMWPHHLEQALKAHHLNHLDVDYVVRDGQVIIVDEFTGRLMEGRRWSDGLHQAVEAKEGLKIKDENQTLATITFQNFFRLYDKLAGMTGTAMTEAEEFREIYGLGVVAIPTNRPMRRGNLVDIIYRTKNEKWTGLIDNIQRVNEEGRPILVGTISIEDSELLSGRLDKRGIRHNVLNAKQHAREAEIVAEAGQTGRVTIATNMAGRGTDIVLGEGVIDLGGLLVIGSERHESRRVDNQLRGRCGRQGDPGDSQFYLSLEDDLMRIFASERVSALLKRFGMDEGVDITHPMVTRAVERAQKKVEQRNFEVRKNLLEYDGVMDSQRKVIYELRDRALKSEDLQGLVLEHFEKAVSNYSAGLQADPETKEEASELLTDHLRDRFNLSISATGVEAEQVDSLISDAIEKYRGTLAEKREIAGAENLDRLLHYIVLRAVDEKWKDHLHAMDQLRAGIGMRGYAQVDPKLEYKREGYQMFAQMLDLLHEETSSLVTRIRVEIDESEAERSLSQTWSGSTLNTGQMQDQFEAHGRQMEAGIRSSQRPTATVDPIKNTEDKVGRNDPCPCGSGKKYKRCHG